LLEPRYHKYTLYAHNLGGYELDLISMALQILVKTNEVKIDSVIKDGEFISMKIRFGYRKDYNKYRYYILLHIYNNILPLSLNTIFKHYL